MTSARDRVLVDITISASAETVFDAVRDPAVLKNWFGWDYAGLEDEIAFIFRDHATEDRAAGIVQFGEHEGVADRFEIVSEGEGTRLRVVRSATAPDGWENVFEPIAEGWISFAAQLKVLLDRHLGRTRRTIFLSGDVPAGRPVAAALGIGDGATRADLPGLGETSVVFNHRSSFQLGVLIPELNDALLIVAEAAAGAEKPPIASITLNTWDIADDRFAALSEAWSTWWGAYRAA